MAPSSRSWPKPLQRFVSGFVVFGAPCAPVAWWVFSRSPFHALLYWLTSAAIFAVLQAVGGETRMDRLFRKLPWWSE